MKKLLSLPPNLVECFHDVEKVERSEWFCTSDPVGSKLGSGGGTAWLLDACRQEWAPDCSFHDWLGQEKRILLHAGGQSRRLPGYAPSGKVLTPVPVFRWARGQRLSQNLLSLQLPLYEQILEKAPESLHTLIASGDVYIRSSQPLQNIPDADVVCYGLWVDPNLAKNHGVFVSSRRNSDVLDYMLQKPSVEELGNLMKTHLFLMDIGIWLLSDRAVELLVKRSHKNGELSFYDMYSEFGLALGEHPRIVDEELNQLSVAILPLPGGEFYHYGTSRELISSTLNIQNLVIDQREIKHYKVKPHHAMFVQNAEVGYKLTSDNADIWIENSCVRRSWTLRRQTIVTGVPVNDWPLDVPSGVCVDVVPMGERHYVARPYGFHDAFRGDLSKEDTLYLGRPFGEWLAVRGLELESIECTHDLQAARIFPSTDSVEELGLMLRWMISEPGLLEGKEAWLRCPKMSADEISAEANLRRLHAQREAFCLSNWGLLAKNYEHSVFYQLNLEDAARQYALHGLDLPDALPDSVPMMTRIGDQMFRARVMQLRGEPYQAYESKAFGLMREGLTEAALAKKQHPCLDVMPTR